MSKHLILPGLLVLAGAAAPLYAQDASETDDHAEEEGEAIVVQATRSGRRVQDEPVRVEVIAGEEVEEKALMRPGSIAMLLSETGGLRVQVTSPALGASNIRVQGLEGRFTQLLADGLPLFGGQAPSLGLLQIAPTDLGQVEVIKGAASALYGPSALGGVINLVSRRPNNAPEGDLLVNATTRDGQDATAYAATPLGGGWGGSLTAGLHRQGGQDLDGDGWRDMPGYDRWTARPRLFWQGDDGASLYLTGGAMHENRRGGTRPGRTVPDGTPFPQNQRTDRLDLGLVGEVAAGDSAKLHLRASGTRQNHRHLFGEVVENDRHATGFAELSASGEAGATRWVGGAAYQVDNFRSATFPLFDYTFEVPGVFAQVEHEFGTEVTLAVSTRLDVHSEYGTQFSPRLSLLWRPGPWTVRASAGRGFYAPTPFVEEIEAAGLSRLAPLSGIQAETARTAALDVGWVRAPFELNATLFASDLDGSTRLETIAATRVRLVNAPGVTRVHGTELLARYRRNGFTVTGSYVFIDAREPDPDAPGRRALPLTPRHALGLVGMWEEHDKGRIGVEAYYTGRQRLDDNPYRSRSRPYFDLGLLGEIVLGRVRLFANAENILDVRQSKVDPLLLPGRAPDGRWTVDAWAPLEGFILNAGIRLKLGGED